MCFQQKSTAHWIAKQYSVFRLCRKFAAAILSLGTGADTNPAHLLAVRRRDALSLKDHCPHLFQCMNVAQRITFDSHEITFLASFNGPKLFKSQ